MTLAETDEVINVTPVTRIDPWGAYLVINTGESQGSSLRGYLGSEAAARRMMMMTKEELVTRWLRPDLFFGASSLITDFERQLEHPAGRYSAAHRHPPG